MFLGLCPKQRTTPTHRARLGLRQVKNKFKFILLFRLFGALRHWVYRLLTPIPPHSYVQLRNKYSPLRLQPALKSFLSLELYPVAWTLRCFLYSLLALTGALLIPSCAMGDPNKWGEERGGFTGWRLSLVPLPESACVFTICLEVKPHLLYSESTGWNPFGWNWHEIYV